MDEKTEYLFIKKRIHNLQPDTEHIMIFSTNIKKFKVNTDMLLNKIIIYTLINALSLEGRMKNETQKNNMILSFDYK